MSFPFRFIIIDDDPIINNIYQILIKRAPNNMPVQTFTNASEALLFIEMMYAGNDNIKPAIIILDINMPIMDGWEFLNRYSLFSEKIKKHIHIYIASSSVSEQDMKQAEINKYVKGYFIKPLSAEHIQQITSELQFSLSDAL